MKSCPKCGLQNPAHTRFCGGCGAALASTGGMPQALAPDRTLVDFDTPGPAPSPVASPRISGIREQYEILEEIGRGGMSIVYRARDLKLNRDVALKRLLPQFTSRDRAVARLMTEARSIASLQHPNIVSVYAIDQDKDGPYIAMEYVARQDGRPLSLEQKIREEGVLGENAAVDLILKLCAAVAHAHAKKIIHRDIKPVNILLAADGTPKLLDFGIAQAAGDAMGGAQVQLTTEGATLGTVDYMAPEQETDARSVDARADVYALGGVLHFCITGHSARHFRERNVSENLRSVLVKALEWKREKRWRSVQEFRAALRQRHESLIAAEPPSTSASAVSTPTVSFSTRPVTAWSDEGLLTPEEAARLGLPPVGSDIAGLLEHVTHLQAVIRQIEQGIHPAILALRQAFEEAESKWEAINKQLATSSSSIPKDKRSRILEAVNQDSSGSDMRICSLFPGIEEHELLEYVARLRRLRRITAERDQARRAYEEAGAREIEKLKAEHNRFHERLIVLQEQDLKDVLRAFFGNLGPVTEFPLEQWAKVESALKRRGYRWEMGETFRRAEAYFDDLMWEQAVTAGTLEAFASYRQKLPQGQHADEAVARSDDLRWDHAKSAGTQAAIEGYLSGQSARTHVAEARQILDDMLWQQAETKDTVTALEAYLKDCPSGRHASEARQRIHHQSEQAAWQKAAEKKSIADYEAYLKAHPAGVHADEAKALIASRFDQQCWQKAQEQDTPEAYEGYLAAVPEGRSADEARHRLAVRLRQRLLSNPTNQGLRRHYLARRTPPLMIADQTREENCCFILALLRAAIAGAVIGGLAVATDWLQFWAALQETPHPFSDLEALAPVAGIGFGVGLLLTPLLGLRVALVGAVTGGLLAAAAPPTHRHESMIWAAAIGLGVAIVVRIFLMPILQPCTRRNPKKAHFQAGPFPWRAYRKRRTWVESKYGSTEAAVPANAPILTPPKTLRP